MDQVTALLILNGICILLALAAVLASSTAPKGVSVQQDVEDDIIFLDSDEEVAEKEPTAIFIRIPTTEEGWKKLRARADEIASQAS